MGKTEGRSGSDLSLPMSPLQLVSLNTEEEIMRKSWERGQNDGRCSREFPLHRKMFPFIQGAFLSTSWMSGTGTMSGTSEAKKKKKEEGKLFWSTERDHTFNRNE